MRTPDTYNYDAEWEDELEVEFGHEDDISLDDLTAIYIVRDEEGEEVTEACSLEEARHLAALYRGDFVAYS